MLLGPEQVGSVALIATLWVRRYLCRQCGAVIVVCPREVLPGRRYRAGAIAAALALWSVQGLASAAVRRLVSPFRIVGTESQRCWRTLRRWAAAACWLWPRLVRTGGSCRQAAHEAVVALAAAAPLPSGSLLLDAVAGARFADGHRLRLRAGPAPTS
jgi:hypothetical protein